MPSEISQRDIIIVGQQPWDVTIGSNCKNIALEFSRQNRVLYVNSPLDRITSIRNRKDPGVDKRLQVINKKENGLVPVRDNLWVLYPDCLVESVNWITNEPIFDLINRYNGKKFAGSIMTALAALGFSDFILFNDNEIIKCFYLSEFLKPACSIYYSRDYILATEYWKKHGTRLEPLVIKANDICVANSLYLQSYCKQYNRHSFYVGQGCELDLFDRGHYEMPEELKHIGGPIIGYVGAILAMRLDIEILKYIAINRPGWTIVLVGPEDKTFEKSELHNFSNIIFTGSQSSERLPEFINSFHVCINPQVLNELTIGNYPRKVDEYLALGKPVVATATKAMETFADYVYLAESKDAYVDLITMAMASDSPALAGKRRSFARTHTWANSVKEIYTAINSVESTNIKLITSTRHEPDAAL